MAKFVKPKDKWHRFCLRTDRRDGEMLLVGTGRNAYLWACGDDGGRVLLFSGQTTLRKLAYSILKTVPARKRKCPPNPHRL